MKSISSKEELKFLFPGKMLKTKVVKEGLNYSANTHDFCHVYLSSIFGDLGNGKK